MAPCAELGICEPVTDRLSCLGAVSEVEYLWLEKDNMKRNDKDSEIFIYSHGVVLRLSRDGGSTAECQSRERLVTLSCLNDTEA